MNLMPRTQFILASSVLPISAYIVIALGFQDVEQPNNVASGGEPRKASARTLNAQDGNGAKSQFLHSMNRGLDSEGSTPFSNTRHSPRIKALTTSEQFQVRPEKGAIESSSPSAQQSLRSAAKRVEQQAQSELEMLSDRFDLTADQQQRIFPLLAQAAADYTPGMSIGLASYSEELDETTITKLNGDSLDTPDAVEDAIYEELDADQQEEMVEAAIDNQLWWAEVIDQLEADLESEVAGVTTTTTTTTEEVETTDQRQRLNIFDLVENAE